MEVFGPRWCRRWRWWWGQSCGRERAKMPVAGAGGGGGAARWQLALLVGAPLALGLGYLWMRHRRERAPQKEVGAGLGSRDSRDSRSAPVSLDEGAPPDAAAALEQALRLKVQGNKAFHAAEYEEAVGLYERAIAACPTERPKELATFYQNRSACHEKRERWDLVKRDCTEALRLDPRYVRAFLRRARAAEKSGDLAMALEDVTAACILEQFQVRLISHLHLLLLLHRRVTNRRPLGHSRLSLIAQLCCHILLSYVRAAPGPCQR